MKPRRTALSLLLLAAACGAAWADEPPRPAPGARGTLLTTLEGREPREIPVRYLGKYHGFLPGHDVHLVEMEGPDAERVGAASGMSGSPVYFDGRLLGALAYRLGAFPKSPIAGITPIEEMRDASRVGAAPASRETGAMQPIATPVLLGGIAPPLRDWLTPKLEEFGFVAVAGGAGTGTEIVGAEIAPGAPLGVALVQGDVRIAASGTVTAVEGEVVYAFGHPFFGAGRVEMPMAKAEVVHTLADWAGSFHMVNLGPTVGSILEDRQTAIVGRLGHEARMVPFHVRVRGGDYRERSFDFSVIAHSELTPMLGAVATVNSLFYDNGYTDKGTVLATGALHIRGLPELPLEMAFSSSQGIDPSVAVAGRLMANLQALWVNPFEEIDLVGVDLTLDVRSEPVSYRIEKLQYDRGPVASGETLKVRCVLSEHHGGTTTRELELPLPDRLPARGRLTLAVSSPAGINQVLGNPLAARLGSAKDLRAAAEVLAEQGSAHRLTAVIYEQGGTVVSRGFSFSDLPPTAERLLSLDAPAPERGAARLRSALGRAEVALDGPVENGLQLRLKIERGVLVAEEDED